MLVGHGPGTSGIITLRAGSSPLHWRVTSKAPPFVGRIRPMRSSSTNAERTVFDGDVISQDLTPLLRPRSGHVEDVVSQRFRRHSPLAEVDGEANKPCIVREEVYLLAIHETYEE